MKVLADHNFQLIFDYRPFEERPQGEPFWKRFIKIWYYRPIFRWGIFGVRAEPAAQGLR